MDSLAVTVIPHPDSLAESYKVSIINGTQTCTLEASANPLRCTITGLDKAGHEYTVGARACAWAGGSSEVCSTSTVGRMRTLQIGESVL